MRYEKHSLSTFSHVYCRSAPGSTSIRRFEDVAQSTRARAATRQKHRETEASVGSKHSAQLRRPRDRKPHAFASPVQDLLPSALASLHSLPPPRQGLGPAPAVSGTLPGPAETSGTGAMPLDWALARSVTLACAFTSRAAPPWPSESKAPFRRWRQACAALQAGGAVGRNAPDAPLSERLQASLAYYQYPSAARALSPPAASAPAPSAPKPKPATLSLRRAAETSAPSPELAAQAEWDAAALSAFDAFRAGLCAVLVAVQLPGGGAQGGGNVALFRWQREAREKDGDVVGEDGALCRSRCRPLALLARSTAGLRRLLQDALGAPFSAPYLPRSAGPAAAASQPEQGASSTLCFEGMAGVHALFDLVLNDPAPGARASWTFLAPVPFLHASLTPACVEVTADGVSRSVVRLRPQAGGLLPPWVGPRAARLLVRGGADEVVVATDAHALSSGLAWGGGAGGGSGAPRGEAARLDPLARGGWEDEEERELWLQPVPEASASRLVLGLSFHQDRWTASLGSSLLQKAS